MGNILNWGHISLSRTLTYTHTHTPFCCFYLTTADDTQKRGKNSEVCPVLHSVNRWWGGGVCVPSGWWLEGEQRPWRDRTELVLTASAFCSRLLRDVASASTRTAITIGRLFSQRFARYCLLEELAETSLSWGGGHFCELERLLETRLKYSFRTSLWSVDRRLD